MNVREAVHAMIATLIDVCDRNGLLEERVALANIVSLEASHGTPARPDDKIEQVIRWIKRRGGVVSPRGLVASKLAATSADAHAMLNDLAAKGHGAFARELGPSGKQRIWLFRLRQEGT